MLIFQITKKKKTKGEFQAIPPVTDSAMHEVPNFPADKTRTESEFRWKNDLRIPTNGKELLIWKLRRLNKENDIEKLPTVEYSELIKNYPEGELTPDIQGSGYWFFNKPEAGKTKALHALDAIPCVILICIAKDKEGSILLGGMAHLDIGGIHEADKFFEEMKKNSGSNAHTFEVSMLSGSEKYASTVFSHVQKFALKNKVSYDKMCCDLDKSRRDHILLEIEGNKSKISRIVFEQSNNSP